MTLESNSRTNETNKLENLEAGTIHSSTGEGASVEGEERKLASIDHALKLGGIASIFAGLSYVAGLSFLAFR